MNGINEQLDQLSLNQPATFKKLRKQLQGGRNQKDDDDEKN